MLISTEHQFRCLQTADIAHSDCSSCRWRVTIIHYICPTPAHTNITTVHHRTPPYTATHHRKHVKPFGPTETKFAGGLLGGIPVGGLPSATFLIGFLGTTSATGKLQLKTYTPIHHHTPLHSTYVTVRFWFHLQMESHACIVFRVRE